MTTSSSGRSGDPAPSDVAILAELRALVRRRISEQAANASETEAGYDVLDQEHREEVRKEIRKQFPTRSAPQELPPDGHKKAKDTTTRRVRRAK